MSTTTSGATIFYTKDGTSTPTHTGSTAGTNTFVYGGAVNVAPGTEKIFQAIASKAGMTDSDVIEFDADNRNRGMAPMTASSSSSTTTIFSVWDGDWAILEEYTTGNVLVESYVQGYHGLVKTLQTNIYYYQDELGSTSHIADVHGALLEYYKYDLYGKPTFFSSTSQPLNSSTYGVKDLFTGQRWIPELGLYDDRNRFMSPDLGRFLQPDPIGFKGDSSNLYRYCGNDWANRSDPMGLSYENPQLDKANSQYNQQDQHMDGSQQIEAMELRNCAYAPTANQVERSGGNATYSVGNGQTLKVQGSTWYKGASYSVGMLSPASARPAIAAAANAEADKHSTDWAPSATRGDFGPGTNKCSLFVSEMINRGGAWAPLISGNNPFHMYPPTAGAWGNPNVGILGWKIVSKPHPGDVAAVKYPGNVPGASGHCGIYVGNRQTVSAASSGTVVRNDWGFRPGQPTVFRTFVGLVGEDGGL